jgi:murein DD-endopeptidase MepM/ murein hydrolase activator NlpD
VKRAYPLAALAGAALLAGIAGAAPVPGTDAAAVAVRIAVPGQPDVTVAETDAPSTARVDVAPFVYPADGSLVRLASASTSVTAQAGASASAQGFATALTVSLFGGEITAEAVSGKVTAAAGEANLTVDTTGSVITALTVLGRQITPSPGLQVPLADWGTLDLLSSTTTAPSSSTPGAISAEITALRVRVAVAHGTAPAGTTIELGIARAGAEAVAPPPAPPPAAPTAEDRPAGGTFRGRPGAVTAVLREPGSSIPGAPADLVKRPPQDVSARLSAGGYVFPVYGSASFGDTFGAPRADVAGGWHHGEDIFGPHGSPLLAVADGTIFSVGWNDIGGWRLWLRDRAGNEFYYAHLSAYSPLAVDGTAVRAGDVIGFMGRTGDAEASPPHLHFEIHPTPLLSLGYDGAVAPYPYLVAWRRAEDVAFSVGRIYTPQAGAEGLPIRDIAVPAGAILLQSADISRTSGLVPGGPAQALTRAG